MATAKKLPSGNWRVRAGDGKSGKVKSFTAPTKNEAEYLALQYAMSQHTAQVDKTVTDCITDYVESKKKYPVPYNDWRVQEDPAEQFGRACEPPTV